MRLAPVAALALLLAGCLNLEPRTNPTSYYVLGGAWDEASGTSSEVAGPSVGLRELELAAYLETPRMVVRTGRHGIRYAEYDRWAEGLNRGINRSVAGYLAAQQRVQRVDVVPWPRWVAPDYFVQLRVLRFEGVAVEQAEGEKPAPGEVHVLATWEIVDAAGGDVLARGTTDYREEGWAVDDYDELAAILDEGLRSVAQEIDARIGTLMPR